MSRPLTLGQIIGSSEQSNRGIDILRLLQMETDPATFGQKVMRFDAPVGDQFIPHGLRKRNINE